MVRPAGLNDPHRLDLPELDPRSIGQPANDAGRSGAAREVDDRLRTFSEGRRTAPTTARIDAFWSDATNWSGLTNFRFTKPGDPMTFRMRVDVQGNPDDVIAEVWTNANNNQDPQSYYAKRMTVAKKGDQLELETTIPIEKLGNYRAIGRISLDGGKSWKWMSEFGVEDMRFRTRHAEHESLNEKVVHVGMANGKPGDWQFSTFADLTEGKVGNYNLESLKAQGVNAIRLQPPFRSDPWDQRHPFDTAGSPYAATDFFAIDPRASRGCHEKDLSLSHWDRDEAMRVANAEFKAFVDKAKDLGIKVILDIAINHVGHNFTFRDYFANRAEGDRVMRNNFSQIAVNPEQLGTIEKNLRDLGGNGYAEQLFPQMFAHKDGDPNGAQSVWDTMSGEMGEWKDVKELNHGGRNWGIDERNEPINHNVSDWLGRVLEYWVNEMGVDGFRIDHATNIPSYFWENPINKLHASTDKPIAIVGEDFQQVEKIRPYVDALEGGWYHEGIKAFKSLDVGGLRGMLQNDYYNETSRTGNHDEERIIHAFDGDLNAAGRYIAGMQLLGGWFTSVMGDEYGEGQKFEFKHTGTTPPVLWQARLQNLAQANLDLSRTVSQAGHMKTQVDALKTARREWLQPINGGHNNDIVPVARHADGSDQTVLMFMNLSNTGWRSNTFELDPISRGRLDRKASYQVKDLMDGSWGKNGLWAQPKSGKELIEQGVFVDLKPYQIQTLLLEKVG